MTEQQDIAVIDDSARETYVREGAVRIENAFSRDWVERLTNDILAIWATFRAGGQPEPVVRTLSQNPPSCGNEFYGGYELRNIAPCSRAMQDWIAQSPAAHYVAELTGANDVRFWMDSTFVKEPETGEAATPWHTDGSTYPFRGEQMPTMWLPLTDVDEANAPLVTVAGSHRVRERFHSNLSRQDIELPGYRPWSDLLDMVENAGDDLRIWTARAGDMVLMHPQMIHGSHARAENVPGRRIGMSTRWLGSDARWLPDAYSARIACLEDQPDLKEGEQAPERLFAIVHRR